MGDNQSRSAARLAAIEQAMAGRPHGGPTLAEIPHGHLIAELLTAALQGDQLAAVKAGCLLPHVGDVSGALAYLASQEVGQQADVRFWEAVGARPTDVLPRWRGPGV